MPRITKGNFVVPNPEHKDFKPVITDKDYKHSLVSTKRQPLASLLTHVEGTALTVHYYSQVLGRDEEPSTFDFHKDGVIQQYVLIRNMELKLQSELNTSIDTSDQTLSLTGSAVMYPYNKPNVGDVFVADVGDGKAGLFTVTEVEKKSMFKQACYEINFTLSDYMSSVLEERLNSRVVKETEFVKDFMLYGQNPILATADKLKLDKLNSLKASALGNWLTEFYSNEFKTILVPMPTAVYDPFIVQAVIRLFNKYEHPLLNNITLINADDQQQNLRNDVWEALIQRETYILKSSFSEASLVASRQFIRNPFLQTAYWTGIHQIVFPTNHNYHIDDVLKINKQYNGVGMTANHQSDDTTFTLPKTNGGYVFSKEFYKDQYFEGISTLELLVYNYLNRKANDWQLIVKGLESRHEWSRLERFYYVPVLLILAIAESRSM